MSVSLLRPDTALCGCKEGLRGFITYVAIVIRFWTHHCFNPGNCGGGPLVAIRYYELHQFCLWRPADLWRVCGLRGEPAFRLEYLDRAGAGGDCDGDNGMVDQPAHLTAFHQSRHLANYHAGGDAGRLADPAKRDP